MNLRSRRLAWHRWASIDGFGVATLRRLEAVFGSLDTAWQTPLLALQQRGGLNKSQVESPDGSPGHASPPCRHGVGWPPLIPLSLCHCINWIVPPLQLFWQGKGEHLGLLEPSAGGGGGGEPHRQ